MTEALASLNVQDQAKLTKEANIFTYLESRHVSNQLKKRIEHFYAYLWDMHSTEDPGNVLSDLHPQLRYQVYT